jgi:translation initiation factor 2B subunit (eIF-2B alpha/beta/delta family)
MPLITLPAQRLQWLHLFARNERWKEEVLLTVEEIRRLRQWHKTKARNAEISAMEVLLSGDDWEDRGLRSLRNSISIEANRIYQAQPLPVSLDTIQLSRC